MASPVVRLPWGRNQHDGSTEAPSAKKLPMGDSLPRRLPPRFVLLRVSGATRGERREGTGARGAKLRSGEVRTGNL